MPAALGMVAANLIGGGIGNAAASGDRAKSEAASQAAMKYLESVGIPSVEAQQIVLQNPQLVGQFQAQLESAEQLGPSAMQGVSTDPRLAQAQMNSLQSLEEQGANPLNAMEKAQLNSIRRGVAQEAQARQNSILQNMAERGVGGSGMELAARLQASQASAQRQGEESDALAAMAQQRALESIAQAGQLGGQIRSQDFGEQAQKASAADIIAQFNAQNRQNVQTRNVGAQNQAAQREADLRQQLENQRAATANYQTEYNKKLLQQNFQNQMDKARGLSGQSNQQAQNYNQSAAQTANMWGQIGSGVGQGIGAIEAMNTKKEEDKKKAGAV